MEGKLYIVGVGPGHHDHMTFRAKQVIEESDTIVGYTTYVNLVEDLIFLILSYVCVVLNTKIFVIYRWIIIHVSFY